MISKQQLKSEKADQKLQIEESVQDYYSLQSCFCLGLRSQFVRVDRKNFKQVSAGQKGGFAFCDAKLNKEGLSRMRFFVESIMSFVYLGIANVEQFQKAEFTPNLRNVGHGAYLISNFGDTYSNHEKKKNYKRTRFQFHGNLIITMTIDYPQKTITWRNPQYQSEFSLKFDPKVSFQPVVGVRNASVQLLD